MKGASRFGEGHKPACHLRLPRVCLHLAHPSMYGTTCLPAARSVASHRDNESSPCAGRRAPFSCTQHRLHEEVVGFMRYESYGKAIGPPARRCRFVGKMLAKCVPGRSAMAKCTRNAFPSVRRWRDCALMRSWPDWQRQYTRAVRSRVPCRDKIPPRCVPECLAVARFHHGAFPGACRWQNAREMRPRAAIRGKFCAPCIPKVASDGKIASSWQHIAAVYPK